MVWKKIDVRVAEHISNMIYDREMRLKGSTHPEQPKMIASMMIMAKKMGVFFEGRWRGMRVRRRMGWLGLWVWN